MGAQELRNNCSETKVKPILKFIAEHYGAPLQIENIAYSLHWITGALAQPFDKESAAPNFQSAKMHLNAFQLIHSMFQYMEKEEENPTK